MIVVKSYYPFLALRLVDGFSAYEFCNVPADHEEAFCMLQTRDGRRRLSQMIGRKIGDVSWPAFDAQVDAIESQGVGVAMFREENYPRYLLDIADPPPLLFFKGDIGVIARRGIAVVGARQATARGCGFARHLAADLVACDITVASGLARGIDAAAHRGALDGGGRTVGVIGTGLDIRYPKQNASLYDEIPQNGCVITEQLLGTPPRGFVFPRRNRLISGLSHAVVVVEAGRRSGALITARWALEQGRDVGAVPGFPGETTSRGVNALLKDGAFPVEGVEDVLAAVPLLGPDVRHIAFGRPQPRASGLADDLAPEYQAVLGALSAAAVDLDALAVHLGVAVVDLQGTLLDLEMRGVVARNHAGDYYKT